MPDLLLELLSEEIPARMQARAAENLKRLVTNRLAEAGLTCSDGRAFSTPRRLTLALSNLPATTPDRLEERKGPRVDAPEKALEGFLRSTGVSRDDLEVRGDKKGQVWFAVIRTPRRSAADIVAEAVEHVARTFPWPKSMRWGVGSLRWVRPLHGIVCILTDDAGHSVVPLEIDGIRAGNTTRGHRFLAPEAFSVSGFDDYSAKLEQAHVVLDAEERIRRIEADAGNLAFAIGAEVIEDHALMAEVAGLVEWPVVLMGEIGEEFLDLPPEILRTSMREHQKFFSVRSGSGRIERFVTVANMIAADDGATIMAGNRKVLAARLSDAKFFWENDLRTVRADGMDGMGKALEAVTFHAGLGSQAARVTRIEALAREIAPKVGARTDLAAEAARICKVDLVSDMVTEFPELQGVMGAHYAREVGHDAAVSEACRTHHGPLGPSDEAPTEPVAVAVALADKLDMLTGFWAIDEKPSGSRDPFALRRAALGIIRIILENGLRMGLSEIMRSASSRQPVAELPPDSPDPRETIPRSLMEFIADRLEVHLRDRGVGHDAIRACLRLGGQDDLVLLIKRVRALQAFLDTEDGENLLAGYRRAVNIVTIEERKDGVEYSGTPEARFAEDAEEHALFAALDRAEPAIVEAIGKEDFAAAMREMAILRAPIDAFFDKVTVNAENGVVRRNRLCLLNRVREAMRKTAVWDAIGGRQSVGPAPKIQAIS